MESCQVFLSHNSKDKAAVRALRKELVEKWGISAWLDEEELRPGLPWRKGLEEGVRSSQSIAVLLGGNGLGDWQTEEMDSVLQLAAKDGRPVIPVILPDAPENLAVPSLSLFLSSRTLVDLRQGITDQAISNLIWGITGVKPKKLEERRLANPLPRVSGLNKTGLAGDIRSRDAETLAMLIDKQVPVTEALRRRADQNLSAFIFIGMEEHWPEAISHRMAFDLLPLPKSYTANHEPSKLDLTLAALVTSENPKKALEACVCGLYSLSGIQALLDHLGRLKKPVVYFIKTYLTEGLYFQPCQIKEMFEWWEQSIAQYLNPKPLLVLIVEFSKASASPSSGGLFSRWLSSRKKQRPTADEQYVSDLKRQNMADYVLPGPTELQKGHIKAWIDELRHEDYPWLPDKDTLREAAYRLFETADAVHHYPIGKALKGLLIAAE